MINGRTSKNLIFFLPVHEPSFREHLVLAKWVKQNTRFTPLFIISNDQAGKLVSELDQGEILWIKVYSGKIQSSLRRGSSKAIFFVEKLLSPLSAKMVFDYLKWRQQLPKDYKKAIGLIQKFQPIAIFLTGDRHLGFELPLMKAAKQQKIKTIILPTGYSDIEGSLHIRKNSRAYRVDSVFPIFNHFLFSKKEMGGQIYNSPQGKFAFYNAGITLALYQNGMLPPSPWVMGSGDSNLVAVDGQDTKERYMRAGVPERKIVITGHQSHDILYECERNKQQLRTTLYKKYLFDSEKKLIILAVPQLGEHRILPWPEHWKEIKFLVSTLGSLHQNLLLSLHPKSDYSQYQFLEQSYRCKISQEPLVKILVACDCYIATLSSTIQWAIVCGIPAVVVDFYGMGYDVFDKFRGVLKITKKETLSSMVARILYDPRYSTSLRTEQAKMAFLIGPFDGKACKRITALIQDA